MGCRYSGITVKLPAVKAPVLGESELVLVKYTGWIDEIKIESVTGALYVFELGRNKQYVDSRDVEAILALTEDTKKMFELAE